MNKSVLALALAAVTTTATAAEIYNQDGTSLVMSGRAEATIGFQDGKSTTDASKFRLGFKAKTDITDTVYGVGYYEGEFTDNNDTIIDNRYIYVGIGGELGELVYGKVDGSLGMISDITDVLSNAGNLAGGYKLAAADRQTNMLNYTRVQESKYGQSIFKASLHAEENQEFDDETYLSDSNDAGGSVGMKHVGNGGLNIGFGIAMQGDLFQAMGGVGYKYKNLYVAGLVNTGTLNKEVNSDIDLDADLFGYDVTAAYTFNDKTVIALNYGSVEMEGDLSFDGIGELSAEGDNSAVAMEVTHYFKPTLRAYANYTINTASKDFEGNEDKASVGLRYDF